MNEWRLIRWGLVVSCSCMTLIIGMVDYPADTKLWTAVMTSAGGGWWHETLLIFLGHLVALDLTYHWQKKSKKVVYVVLRPASDAHEPTNRHHKCSSEGRNSASKRRSASLGASLRTNRSSPL